MADSVVVCVDAGTTVIKAVAFDEAGREVAAEQAPTTVHRPTPDRSEQDPDEVWAAVATVVRSVRAHVPGPVRALAVTAQGDGAWLVDAAGRPTRPAVLWNDARAATVVEAWDRDGVLDAAFRRTGSLGNAGLPHAILTVLRQAEPDVLAHSRAALTCGGWLFLRMTGVCGLDRSEASAPWLDLRPTTSPLLQLYGLADLADLVPPLLEGGDRVQPLAAAAAGELGLPVGLPVVLAPYDIATTALGAGAVTPGQAVTILGTTLCTETILASDEVVPGPDAVPVGLTLDLELSGLYLRAFPTLAGTGVLDWTAELLGLADAAAVTALAAAAPAGADGLIVLPYLSPAGERAPFLDPAARGAVTGVTFAHGRAHLARATLEGLAHVVRECLDATPGGPGPLRLTGGGAASDSWAQIIADVSGREVLRTEDRQVGAKGALLVALTVLGDHPDVAAAAAALVRERDRRAPDAAVRALHDDRHAAFLAARAAIAPTWHRPASTGAEPAHV
jgi:erythritol kinase (D-erythritol 1-phosphate-forming)